MVAKRGQRSENSRRLRFLRGVLRRNAAHSADNPASNVEGDEGKGGQPKGEGEGKRPAASSPFEERCEQEAKKEELSQGSAKSEGDGATDGSAFVPDWGTSESVESASPEPGKDGGPLRGETSGDEGKQRGDSSGDSSGDSGSNRHRVVEKKSSGHARNREAASVRQQPSEVAGVGVQDGEFRRERVPKGVAQPCSGQPTRRTR